LSLTNGNDWEVLRLIGGRHEQNEHFETDFKLVQTGADRERGGGKREHTPYGPQKQHQKQIELDTLTLSNKTPGTAKEQEKKKEERRRKLLSSPSCNHLIPLDFPQNCHSQVRKGVLYIALGCEKVLHAL